MVNFIDQSILVMAPISATMFLVDFVWTYLLEKSKPKTGSAGQPLNTTPPGYPRSQAQINKERPIIDKFNKDMELYRQKEKYFKNVEPYLKRGLLYTSLITICLGILKLSL